MSDPQTTKYMIRRGIILIGPFDTKEIAENIVRQLPIGPKYSIEDHD